MFTRGRGVGSLKMLIFVNVHKGENVNGGPGYYDSEIFRDFGDFCMSHQVGSKMAEDLEPKIKKFAN